MTDRQLLKLAAKAAGYKVDNVLNDFWLSEEGKSVRYWNPLTDDGDALRLAVKLRLQVTPGTYKAYEASVYRALAAETHEMASMAYSLEEATRRAIVRAAAAIGEKK